MNRSVVLIILFALLPAARSDFSYAFHSCSNTTTYPHNSTYSSNLRALLTTLSNSSTSHFNNASTQTRERIQALYQCRNDISLDECKAGVSNASSLVLEKCPIEKTAVIWYDKCLLRFSNEIVSVPSTSPTWILRDSGGSPEDERVLFYGFVRNDLNDCVTEAANSPSKFAVRERNTNFNLSFTSRIYSLVQCTADVSNDDCSRCLLGLLGIFPSCCSTTVGARVLNPSCNFRYETSSFYDVSEIAPAPAPSPSSSPFLSSIAPLPSPSLNFNATEDSSPENSGLSKSDIISIAASTGLLAVLLCIGCFGFIRRRVRTNNLQEIGPIREESLVFNLSTLKAATNNFSFQNLLGHGGYGDVSSILMQETSRSYLEFTFREP